MTIPGMYECSDLLDDATIFSTLGPNIEYWPVAIFQKIVTRQLFRLILVLSVLHECNLDWNPPQGRLSERVRSFLRTSYGSCPCLLDYIVLLSQSPDQHVDYVRQPLTIVHVAQRRILSEKCEFFTNQIDFQGLTMRRLRFRVSMPAIDIIQRFSNLTTAKYLWSFLKFCNFCSSVSNMARAKACLNYRLPNGPLQTFVRLAEG